MKSTLIFKILAIILVFAFVFSAVYVAFAASEVDEEKMTAKSIMLIDQQTGEILYAKNAEARIAPASTTKIMTALVALEKVNLDDEVTVGTEVKVTGSSMGLKPGQTVTVRDLLYGMFLMSGNDAAAALAVHVAGSTDAFAELMNQKAAALGMEHSHFVTVSGRDNEEHYVTASDMALLAREACNNETIMEFAGTTTYSCTTVDKTTTFDMKTTNYLIYTPVPDDPEAAAPTSYEYEYATGLKTGSTPDAGGCVVATAEKDGQKLIALVFGDESDKGHERWGIAAELFNYGFENYKNIKLADLADNLTVKVPGAAVSEEMDGTVQCVPVAENGSEYLTVPRDMSEEDVQCSVSAGKDVAAPVTQGDVVGTVEISVAGKVVFHGNLQAASDVMSEEEYKKLTEGPVTSMEPVDIEDTPQNKASGYVWLWLIVPVGLIVFLIIRYFIAKGRRRRYHSRGGTRYRYRSKRRRRY